MSDANATNTKVKVLTTTTTLRGAGNYKVTILTNNGLSDVWVSVGDSARVGEGIKLGSPLSVISSVTQRLVFDHASLTYDEINAVAETTTTSVAIFYR